MVSRRRFAAESVRGRLRVPAVVLGLTVPLALCSCWSFLLEDVLDVERRMDEEQKRQYEELQKMGCLVVKNASSAAVYLVVDGVDYGRIPPKRRVSITVRPGVHRLVALTEDGRTRYSATLWAEAPDNGVECSRWRIGE